MPAQCRLRSWVALAGIAAVLVAQTPAAAQTTIYDYMFRGFNLNAGVYGSGPTSYNSVQLGAYESVTGPGKPSPSAVVSVWANSYDWGTMLSVWCNAWGEVPSSAIRASSEALTTPASVTATLSGWVNVTNWADWSGTWHAATFTIQCALEPPADVSTSRERDSSTYSDSGSTFRHVYTQTGRSGWVSTGSLSCKAVLDDGTVLILADNAPVDYWSSMGWAANGWMALYKIGK